MISLLWLVIATTLEVTGDAIVRIALYNHSGLARVGMLAGGGLLLLGYGWCLNLAPLEFRQVVGLYIATLFIVWQVVNAVIFRTYPTVPVAVGGVLIVAGGLIVTFWKPAAAI